jgi:hypothetical protein
MNRLHYSTSKSFKSFISRDITTIGDPSGAPTMASIMIPVLLNQLALRSLNKDSSMRYSQQTHLFVGPFCTRTTIPGPGNTIFTSRMVRKLPFEWTVCMVNSTFRPLWQQLF